MKEYKGRRAGEWESASTEMHKVGGAKVGSQEQKVQE